MHFANPYYFLLTFFILAFILFYFFRKQYKNQVIPSNLLWNEVLKEMRASSWFHKWQNNLLFWLQLICFFLLMFALVQPYFLKSTLKGEQIILLFDTSASMASTSKDTNRLAESKKDALEMIGALQKNQTVTVIEVSDEPSILLHNEGDIKKIKDLINQLEISYTHENMEKASEIALTIADEGKSAIHIFSDRVTQDSVKNLQAFYTEVHNKGNLSDENISLLSFGVAKKDNTIAGIAMIENQTSSDKTVPFHIESEGSILLEEEVKLEPNEKKLIDIAKLPKKSYYTATIDIKDQYPIDNTQTAIFHNPITSIYTKDTTNSFLIKGFSTMGLDVKQMKNEEDFLGIKDSIHILTGSKLPENPQQPFLFFYETNKKRNIISEIEESKDELLSHVDMSDVFIKSAANYEEKNFETSMNSGEIPLVQKGIKNGQPAIIVNFSIQDSDWPLHPSFPIFLYNCYQWLSSQSTYIGDFQPLETRTLTLKKEEWDIYDEKDQLIKSFNTNKESFQAPRLPGVYQLTSDKDIFYFSVNPDDREKDIQSEKSFSINREKMQESKKMDAQNNVVSYIFTLILFILLIMEWEVYRRANRV